MQPVANARDFIFDFRDSCNCCIGREKATTRMYVHRNGDASPYRTRQSRAESAAQRTFDHVMAAVERVGSLHHMSPAETHAIALEAGCDARELPTRAILRRIQNLMKEAIDRLTPSTPSEERS